MNHTFNFTAAALAALLAGPASAHDIVLQPIRDGVAVRYGHAQDWQPVEPDKLIELQLFRTATDLPQDAQPALKPTGNEYLLTLADGAAKPLLVAARYDNGLWSRVPVAGGGKPVARNTTRFMLPDATLVTNNLKFAKGLVGSADDAGVYKRVLGHLLELVPQRNPAALKAGELLEVLVLLRGKPLAGAGVEVSNLVDKLPEEQIRRWTTDAQGIARVELRPRGVNTLAVDVDVPNDGSLGEASRTVGADKFVLIATYTFNR